MKAVILAGGRGTRLSEETGTRPKPLVEIGARPILWHIMKVYSHYGVNEFIICCGYKGYLIKEYFANYFLHTADVTFDLAENKMEVHKNQTEPWKVTLVDTGENSMTGGRLGRVRPYIQDEELFCLTYGDGVADVNIKALIDFHRQSGTQATVTSVYPPGRFGKLVIEAGKAKSYEEKPKGDGVMVNGGFFVLSPRVLDRIHSDMTVWEEAPLAELAAEGELSVFKHHGFWHPMDTLRDNEYLNKLWSDGKAPWKLW
jgi:glucose-1-phosphate cytidylyltransferase